VTVYGTTATDTFYSAASSYVTTGYETTYAVARAGSGSLTHYAYGPGGGGFAGQNGYAANDWTNGEFAARYDTSALGALATVVSVLVACVVNYDGGSSGVDYPLIQARSRAYNGSVADWVAGASLSGLTLRAHQASHHYGATPYTVTLADDAMAAAIVTNGNTDLHFSTNQEASGSAPIPPAYPEFNFAAYLVITYTRPAVLGATLPKMSALVTVGLGGGVDLGMEVTAWDGATPSTQLAVLQGAKSVRFQHVLNDVGSGSFQLAIGDPKAVSANIREGTLIKVRTRGLERFGFFVEAPKMSVSESGASTWTIAGRGVLSCLTYAVVYPAGMPTPSSTTRDWASATAGTILGGMFDEAVARGCLPNVTKGFTATVDSSGASFVADITMKANAGITILDLAKQLVALGYHVEMTPSLVLNLYKPGSQGKHLESLVVLRQGKHISGPVEKVGNRTARIDAVLVHGSGNAWVESTDAGAIADTYFGRREGSFAFGNVTNATTLGAAGTTQIAVTAANAAAISVPLARGIAPGQYEPYVDYQPGDWVTLDVPGQYDLTSEQIVALTLALTDSGNITVVADMNAIALDYVAKLKQQLVVLAGTSGLLG